jgi:hypothetical protein
VTRKLEVEIIGDASSLHRAVKQSDDSTSKLGKTFGGLAKTGALAAGAAGVGALIYTLKTGIGEFQQSQKVAAQTNAVIKSTGGAAHVTAGHVGELSTALMKKSGVDDEAIASGANMLLTFKNIRNEAGAGNKIFDEATATVLDMSVAFGTDASKSAIQLGKALNDPIKGISALSKIGVTFTESQKATIQSLVDSGKTMEAQKIILAELKSEVGGSAEAMGKTLPGQISILRESFNNWAGEMVAKMIPVLQNFGNWIRTNWPEISGAIRHAWEVDIKPSLEAFSELVASVVGIVRDNWSTIGPIVKTVAVIVETNIKVMIGILKTVSALLRGDWSQAWQNLKGTVSDAVEGIRARVALFGKVGGALWDAARAMANNLVSAVIGGLEGLGGKAWNVINNIGSVISEKIGAAVGWGADLGAGIARGIIDGLKGLPGRIVSMIKAAVNYVIDRINSALEFNFSVNTHIPGVGKIGIGVNAPDIPHMAFGTRNFAGGAAIVGERGPELVSLPRGSSVTPNRGVAPTVVNLNVDGRTLARILIDPLRAEGKIIEQRTGRPAFS